MSDFTTEETLPFAFNVTTAKGKPVDVDENAGPTGVSSDETVATVDKLVKVGKGSFTGNVVSVTPGTAHIIVTADADLGDGVEPVIAEGDVTVTLDPDTGTRIAKLEFGAPAPKP